MGIVAMKYAYNAEKLVEILPKFKDALKKIPHNEATCLLQKISVYLSEYLTEDIQKELDMAFVSVGQKYGFVSAGDVYRQRIADARAEERQKAEEKAEKARDEERADAISVLQDMGMTPEKIAEFKAKLEALKK